MRPRGAQMKITHFAIATTLVLVTAMCGGPALAEEYSVFGITLGQSLKLPKCPATVKWGDPPCVGSNDFSISCGLQWKQGEQLRSIIGFRTNEYVDDVCAKLLDGKVEMIEINTHGLKDQSAAYAALLEKYGPPTEKHIAKMQNRLGAQFDVATATWRKPGLWVEFEGLNETSQRGHIRIQTDKYAAAPVLERWNKPKQKL